MIQTSRLPQGYKDSALEVIPKDWRVKKLGEVFLQLKNFSFSRDQMTDAYQKLRYIHYGDIHVSLLKDSLNMQKDSLPFIFDGLITNEKLNNEDFPYLQNGDIILVDASEDYEGIGKLWEIINTANKKIISGLHTIPLRCFTNEVFVGFGRYVFKNPQSAISLKKIAQGTKVYSISYNHISKLNILLPPLPEQQKIAEILSLWDEAIEKQTQLVAQLELSKRGLMQQLLTGKKRLKGFSGEWNKVKLGEICDIKKGVALTSNDISEGEYPVIAGGKVSPYKHSEYNHENVITISASGAYAGFVSFHKNKIWASDCSVIKEKRAVSNLDYLYQLLAYKQDFIYLLQSGGAQPHVFPKDIAGIKHKVPSIGEQSSIANILTVSDIENDLAKKKLVSLKEQKKGLMQQLLTGKKRIKLL